MRLAESRITKFADITPVFTELAERRESLAEEAEKDDRKVSARDHYFHAALLYASAEWPIWETTPELVAPRRPQERLLRSRTADWPTTTSSGSRFPSATAYIPAWFHLPPGYSGGRVPTVLSCGGMDAAKELNVNLYGDKLLQRGFAVLTFDGPGQGEAPVRGVTFTPTAWIDAGEVLMDWCSERDEVDPSASWVSGCRSARTG